MVWLTGGHVYDVTGGTYRRKDILVRDGRIDGFADEAEPASGEAAIDLAAVYLLPGLIDCHVHLTMPTWIADPVAWRTRPEGLIALHAAKAAERTLRSGTTTVRDCGGWNYHEMALRSAIAEGLVKGPRLFLAGRLLSITTGGVEYYPGMYEVANGADEVRLAARKQLAHGADFIKVMATGAMLSPENESAEAIQYTLDELVAAVEVGRDNLKPVAAHAHAQRGIVNAVEAGVDSIEHGTFADEEVLKLMAEKGTFMVPTCSITPAMLRDDTIAATIPAHLKQRLVDMEETHTQAMRRAHALHVPLVMGTDAGTPGNHHGENPQEVVHLVEAVGMSPEEAILAATLNGARLLRQEAELGSLEEGKVADIIGFRADPIHDIHEIERAAFVMKDGEVVRNELAGT